MISIKIHGDDICIKTTDTVVFEMNWKEMWELEKAILLIKELQYKATFDKLEISVP